MIHNGWVKYGALIGWGIAIYAMLSLLWSGFVIYGFTRGALPHILQFALLVLLCFVAGRSLNFRSWKDVLPYSLAWALEAIALDAILTVPFSGWALYSNATLWAGYAVVVVVPLIAPLFRSSQEIPAHLVS